MKIYHFDLKISMYKIEYIKEWFSKLKELGFDGILIEIDNKLVFPSHPEFASSDALDCNQWNSLVRYAKSIGLFVYPLLQTLGHMEHLLKGSNRFYHLMEDPNNIYMMCPSREDTFKLVSDLMRDLHGIFEMPGIIHLGGDEAFGHLLNKGGVPCPYCRSENKGKLVLKYLKRLAHEAVKTGMIPEFWADEVLAYPEELRGFPRETRFTDWEYSRESEYSNDMGRIWGAADLFGKSIDKSRIQDNQRSLIPFMFAKDGRFDNFYGAHYLGKLGYGVTIASAVRSSGDCYALPRIKKMIRNVGVCEAVSKKTGYDHLVTSWAVRMSHPETTIPGLIASDPRQYEKPEQITSSLGGLGSEEIVLLADTAAGIRHIDIPTEHEMRFQRPYFDDYIKTVIKIIDEGEKETIMNRLDDRIQKGKESLKMLQNRTGDTCCLQHWINGIRLCILRSEQLKGILEAYTGNIDRRAMKRLHSRNLELLEDFRSLWGKSVTDDSLDHEIEIKFSRDIRILENLSV